MNIYEYTMLIHQLATIMQKIKQIQYLNDTLSLIKWTSQAPVYTVSLQ